MSSSMDDLLGMQMDDVEDLPPVGVPPSGHYNLQVTATREKRDDGSEYVQFAYLVMAINQLADEAEAGEVAVNQEFMNFFSPIKKDGTVNDWGMKYLKQEMVPYAQHFGTANFADTLAAIDKVDISAVLTRTKKKGEDTFKFRLSDVIIM